MNGIHDLGGMHGFGPVEPETGEPVFHHEWERRTFALTIAAGCLGRWNLDMSRHSREKMPPVVYLATSYYEHWLWGLERLLGQTGLLTREEIEARTRDPHSTLGAVSPGPLRVLEPADVQRALRDPRGAKVDAEIPPRFKPGDPVRTRNVNLAGHTRLPRYCRGRQGVVNCEQGVWVFPDTHSAGQGRNPQHVYSVRFAAPEIWGPGASPRDSIYVDLWEDYLDAA